MTQTAYERWIDRLTDKGKLVRPSGDGHAVAQCPAHDDGNPSLSITDNRKGQLLVHCHAGCATPEVAAAIGFTMADLLDNPKGIVYPYNNGLNVHRKYDSSGKKTIFQSGERKGKKVLYGDHDAIKAAAVVYLTEGEKCADTLAGVCGVVATTTPGGAGKADLCDLTPLHGKNVVVVQDKDNAGRKHAGRVATILDGKAQVVIAEAAEGCHDATDHVAAGHGIDELVIVDTPTTESTESTELPTPLDRAVELLDFPVDVLPESIAAMVRTVAESSQVNTGMAGAMALGALSAAAGGYVEVEPRAGYREPVNIWPLVIAEPGERKSSVSEAMVKPLHDLEQALAEKEAPLVAEAQTLKEIAEKAAEKAKRDAGNAADASKRTSLTADATGLAAAAAEMTVPSLPRIIADDVTPEAMVSLLADQGGKLAIISAEGGLFNTFAGRYDSNPDLSAFLKAHAGDRIRVDRKGRPSEFINSPALTLALMIQPGVLATASGNKLFHDSGLMARFLYAWPTSRVGQREVDPHSLDQAAQSQYAETITELATRLRDRTDVLVLTLSDAADAERLRYAREIESRLAVGADLAHIRGWASKVVGAAIRIAGLIHVTESRSAEVSVEAMRAGVRFAEYFTTHALHVFDGMARGSDERTLARRIIELIERRGQDKFEVFSERDLMLTAPRSWLPTIDDARPALHLLVEFGWIDPVEVEERSGPGRRPSPKYRVHPSVWSPAPPPQNPQNPQNPVPESNSVDSVDYVATPEHLCKVCSKPCNPKVSAHVECLIPPTIDQPAQPTVNTPGRKPGQWLGSGKPLRGDAA